MMGLDDFNKVSENLNKNGNKKSEEFFVEDSIRMLEDVEYWLYHLDELISYVKDCHYDYVNAKLRYEFKKNEYQMTIKWDEENALRKNNNLPKISNKEQREAFIELKSKPLQIDMKNCELKYKFYKKIFDFISNNFELLCELYPKSENVKILKFAEDDLEK